MCGSVYGADPAHHSRSHRDTSFVSSSALFVSVVHQNLDFSTDSSRQQKEIPIPRSVIYILHSAYLLKMDVI